MVATEAIVNLSTITVMMSQAIPVISSSHHGPACRQRMALGEMLLCLVSAGLLMDAHAAHLSFGAEEDKLLWPSRGLAP